MGLPEEVGGFPNIKQLVFSQEAMHRPLFPKSSSTGFLETTWHALYLVSPVITIISEELIVFWLLFMNFKYIWIVVKKSTQQPGVVAHTSKSQLLGMLRQEDYMFD